jgi:putative hydrolase of the HAD superfamily
MSTGPLADSKRGLVIFDGDDTLWSTMPIYTAAKQHFAALVSELVSPTTAIIRFDEIDCKNVSLMGFSDKRFPSSMLECYHLLCAEHNRLPNKDIEEKVLGIGQSVFTSPAPNVPDADAVLMRLAQYFDLVLATKGDSAVQWERIRQSGLEHCFRDIYVLESKTSREFESILTAHKCEPCQAWSVGDSVRSDINPAIQIGMYAVVVHSPTWNYEDEPLIPTPRAFVANTLTEAAGLIIERSD